MNGEPGNAADSLGQDTEAVVGTLTPETPDAKTIREQLAKDRERFTGMAPEAQDKIQSALKGVLSSSNNPILTNEGLINQGAGKATEQIDTSPNTIKQTVLGMPGAIQNLGIEQVTPAEFKANPNTVTPIGNTSTEPLLTPRQPATSK